LKNNKIVKQYMEVGDERWDDGVLQGCAW